MIAGTCRAAAAALLLGVGAAQPAVADTVVAGRAAQALRCAAYIGMAAQYGFDEGIVSASDRELMASWSVRVLRRWVPLGPDRTMAAYRTMLGELGPRDRAYRLIARHADWCVQAFTPSL